MSERQDVRTMLDAAEAAANSGDLASADDLLQRVAHIQEAELGPLHPDLSNTLNNLAIVAETTGRLSDAERFYRRAVAVASASLPANDPKVVASRQNLEAFCRDHGLPIDAPAPIAAAPDRPEPEPQPIADSDVAAVAKTSPDVPVAQTAPPPPVTSLPASPPAPTVANRSEPARVRTSRTLVTVEIAVAVLLAVTLLVMRPWSARDIPQTVSTTASKAVEPAPSQDAPLHAPIEQTQPPKSGSAPDGNADVRTKRAAGARSAAGSMTLVTSQLCRTLSTTGRAWRCDPVANSVVPGPIVLYTRVRSPRDAVVIHQWYRGNALRKSARLMVRANSTEGYRTYSRQTVHAGEDWRVEVRTGDGDVLYEQRVTVGGADR